MSADILGLAGGGNNCESGPAPSDLGLHGFSEELRCQEESQMEAKLQPAELMEQGVGSSRFSTLGSCGYISHADACAASEGGGMCRVAKTWLENLKQSSHAMSTSVWQILVCFGLVAIMVFEPHMTFPAMNGLCIKAGNYIQTGGLHKADHN